jgi:hypothetical protein
VTPDNQQRPRPGGSLWTWVVAVLLLVCAAAVAFVLFVTRAVTGDFRSEPTSTIVEPDAGVTAASATATARVDRRPNLPPNATTAPKPSSTKGRTFDRQEAEAALAEAAVKASSCKGPPSGKAKAQISFGPGGNVEAVFLEAPFSTSFVAPCIEHAFRSVRVKPYDGDAQRVLSGDHRVAVISPPFTIR